MKEEVKQLNSSSSISMQAIEENKDDLQEDEF